MSNTLKTDRGRVCPKCGRPIEDCEPWQGWSVDINRHVITGPGIKARVAPQVALLMYLLIRDKGEVVPRERLIFGLWGHEAPGWPGNQIQVLMKRLRAAIGTNTVKNAYGVGWYLSP